MSTHAINLISSVLLALVTTHALAADDIEGQNGTLHITGSLHESPCGLKMTSQHQTVDLGVISTGQLLRPGDPASPVAFHLQFEDCQRPAGSIRSEQSANLTWSAHQPVMSVAFLAPADADDPRLAKVQGITGLGLRITDPLGRDVQLGRRGEPLILTLGGSTETWTVHPTRTAAPLSSGSFWAVMGFRLNYE